MILAQDGVNENRVAGSASQSSTKCCATERSFSDDRFYAEMKQKEKGRLAALGNVRLRDLQGGFDFKAPGFEERLRNVLGVLVAAGPFAQTGGT
jgi:hypothetical protein